jgi:hypothetical protein
MQCWRSDTSKLPEMLEKAKFLCKPFDLGSPKLAKGIEEGAFLPELEMCWLWMLSLQFHGVKKPSVNSL